MCINSSPVRSIERKRIQTIQNGHFVGIPAEVSTTCHTTKHKFYRLQILRVPSRDFTWAKSLKMLPTGAYWSSNKKNCFNYGIINCVDFNLDFDFPWWWSMRDYVKKKYYPSMIHDHEPLLCMIIKNLVSGLAGPLGSISNRSLGSQKSLVQSRWKLSEEMWQYYHIRKLTCIATVTWNRLSC